MIVLRPALLISLVAFTTVCQQNLPEQRPRPPASCPLTQAPAIPFTPPGEQEMGENDKSFWLGTERLYLPLRKSGTVWGWLPRGPGGPNWTNKIFWGSVDFDYRKKEDYSLKVTGRRLDGDAPPLLVDRVTNALFEPRAVMLTGVYVPTPGCWQITGDYKGQQVSFVVWLYPEKQANH